MEQAFEWRREELGFGKVDLRRTGSFGDENEGLLIVQELTAKVNGDAISEAALGEVWKLDGKDIETVLGYSDGGEDTPSNLTQPQLVS